VTGPIAVVICSRDRPVSLAATLSSVTAAVAPDDEVVVVDSASRDDRTRAVAEAAGVRVVRAGRPGLSLARNVGVDATSQPVIAFTDDDCRVGDGWRAAIAAGFDDPLVGLVTGPVLADGGVTALSTMDRQEDTRWSVPVRPGDIGHGANMAFRRAALHDAGRFDEALGAGARFRAADDWDMFWRVLRAGWVATYAAAGAVHHDQWRTRRQSVQTRYGYSLGAAAFCVKAARLGDPLGRRLLLDRLRHEGLGAAARGVRQRRLTLAASGAANVAGCLVGAWQARRQVLEEGCYA
jgi:glycosyltransferase involved in cell wall biosynthesis